MSYKKCEICGIRSFRVDGIKRIFMSQFPLDAERCKKWVKVVGNEDLIHLPIEKLHELKYVCKNHFTPNDFNRKKSRLKKNAVPSINLAAKPLADELFIDFPCHMASVVTSPASVAACVMQEPIPSTSVQITAPSQSYEPEPSCSTIKSTCKKTISVGRKRKHSPEPSTSTASVDVELTPRKKKLLKKLASTKITIKELQKKVNILDKIESPALKNILTSSLRNQNRSSHGKRWNNSDKGLALSIYKKSPKAYRFLKQLLQLPSVRTLQSVLKNMDMEPGINKNLLNHLKKKCESYSDQEKICCLIFDEMALKKRLIFDCGRDQVEGYVDLGEDSRSNQIADHALVFMLQGLYKKFKQPLAYFFVKGTVTSSQLSVLIKKVINSVAEAGFIVLATVCDQGPTNIGALNLLKKCSEPNKSNFFIINNEKIFTMFDVPHLFKSIRNNFLQGGEILFEGKKGKWSHIVDLEEKNRSTLHFKKITPLHVNPTYKSKMKVKLAAQILSNTVSAVLKLLAEKHENTPRGNEIQQTAEIVESLDKLFDCTNGPSCKEDIKENYRENVKKNSFHHELWQNYKEKISAMQFLKSDSQLRLKNVRCVNGYLTSISSLQDIWSYVDRKGYKYLNLRQLNQDSLENLFGLIRQHSPTNRNPTCFHFSSALKSSIISKLSYPISRGSNCETDSNVLLFDFHDIVFPKITNVKDDEKHTQEIMVSESEFPVLSLLDEDESESDFEVKLLEDFENQPIVYVSGYLSSQILKGNTCKHCLESLRVDNPQSHPIYNYIKLREWWKDKASLTYPTVKLCETVQKATKLFETDIRPHLHKKKHI